MPFVERIWKLAGKRPLNPVVIAETIVPEGWPSDWFGLANCIHCPRGRFWGDGHFIVAKEDIEALGEGEPFDITCEHENGTTTWKGYYLISTETTAGDPETSAHWCVVADRRYLLNDTAITKRFNLRKSKTKWVESTVDGTTPWTWQEIIEMLWDELPSGIAGTVPTLVDTMGTPENFVFDGFNCWRAIDQVATACGNGIILNPHTGEFSFVNLKDTQAGLSALKASSLPNMLWNEDPTAVPASNYPAEVEVTFRKIPGTDSIDDPFPILPEFETASVPGGGSGGTKWPVLDTLFAWDDNSSARTSRASAIGEIIGGLLKPRAEPFAATYSGVIEFPLGSELTDVTWISDGTRGMVTIAEYKFHEFEWPQLLLGSVSSGGSIQGTLVSIATAGSSSPYNGLKIATITVKLAPCSQSDLIDTDVEVVDWSECVIDLPEATLIGVWVWATDEVGKSRSVDAEEGDLTPCHWAADDRCCVPSEG